MKKQYSIEIFILTLLCALISYQSTAQVTVNASLGLLSGNYLNVKGAFDKINDGTHRGSITIIIGDTPNQIITETAEAALNKSGSGATNYSDVLIIPGASNIKVTSALSGSCCVPTGTIKLNLSQNVIVDGRQNASGSIIDLTIANASTNNYSSAFVFFAASNNILRYCNIRSSTTATLGGVGTISISDNNLGGGIGSSNNTIEYCNITKEGSNLPRRAIASKGASTRENSNNTIRNNTIYDFSEYGIFLGNSSSGEGFNRGAVIENNLIYQPNAFASMSSNQIGICIGNPYSTSAGELGTFVVRNNTIGGNGAGGKWSCTTSSSTYRVAGIALNTLTTAYSTVANNSIKNFNLNMANTASDYGLFSGINVSNGKVHVYQNEIGDLSDLGSITIARSNSTNGGLVTGIHVNSTSNVSNRINENVVSGFSITNGLSNFFNFYGIRNYSSTTYPTDSIYKNRVSYVEISKVNYCFGINGQGFIAKNHVRDIDFTGAATFAELKGIVWNGGHASGSDFRGVENNEIILGRNRSGTSIGGNDHIYGIHVTRGDARVYHNSVVIEGNHTGSDPTIGLLISWSGTIEVANNALYNERNGGTGKHYAISRTGSGASYTAFNNAYVIGTGTNNIMGLLGTTDKATLALWVASPINETASLFDINTNQPLSFLFPLIAQDSLAVTATTWLKAGSPSFVLSDIRDISRDPVLPTIGAYEPIVGLSVELLFFDGQAVGRKNLLYWATSSEINSDYFMLERSQNGLDWEYFGYQQAAGNSTILLNYNQYDEAPFPLTYYRLTQVDFDGTQYIYGPIAISNSTDENDIIIFPNPTTDYVWIGGEFNSFLGESHISVFNAAGQLMLQEVVLHGEESQIFKLNVNHLSGGIYTLRIVNNNKQFTQKLLIIK